MRFSFSSHANGLFRWNPETVQLEIEDGGAGSRTVSPEGWLGPGEAYRLLDRPLDAQSTVTLDYARP